MFVLKELVFAAVALVAVFGQQPETKELFVSRGKINLINSLLNPFNKIKNPRTFTKYTPVRKSTGTTYPTYPSYPDPIPFPSSTGGFVPSQTPTGNLNLDETLAADDRFSTLVAALAVAFDANPDLLNGTSPLTVFAPTNAAFAKVDNATLTGLLADPAALTAVLARHLVANKAVRIPDGTTTLETLGGGSLTVTRSLDDIYSESVTVRSSQGTAKIVDLDIQASDGVIHAIDTVI